MNHAELGGPRLHAALAACPPLADRTPQREELWFVVQDVVCTKAPCLIAPHGTSNKVEVTPDYNHDELVAAMEWLKANEAAARRLSPIRLYVTLRGHATRDSVGSARAAQADRMRGVTNVPSGSHLVWGELEEIDAA
jgi:hypothetical protein